MKTVFSLFGLDLHVNLLLKLGPSTLLWQRQCRQGVVRRVVRSLNRSLNRNQTTWWRHIKFVLYRLQKKEEGSQSERKLKGGKEGGSNELLLTPLCRYHTLMTGSCFSTTDQPVHLDVYSYFLPRNAYENAAPPPPPQTRILVSGSTYASDRPCCLIGTKHRLGVIPAASNRRNNTENVIKEMCVVYVYNTWWGNIVQGWGEWSCGTCSSIVMCMIFPDKEKSGWWVGGLRYGGIFIQFHGIEQVKFHDRFHDISTCMYHCKWQLRSWDGDCHRLVARRNLCTDK